MRSLWSLWSLRSPRRPRARRHLTPHSLRRTYISILLTLGVPLPDVMAMAGHATSAMTLDVYAQVMQSDEGERDRLSVLVNGEPLAPAGAAPAAAKGNGEGSSYSGTADAAATLEADSTA